MRSTSGLRRLDRGNIVWPAAATPLPDVSSIVDRVRLDGDRALRELAATFGDPAPRVVPQLAQQEAYDSLAASVREALEGAAERIRVFARAQREAFGDVEIIQCGVRMGHRLEPVRRVGVYVPGGRYPLASTLLMCVVPARVAGVERLTVCTPRAALETLAAAYIAGVDDVFEIGGAQAIAALAYGTESIAPVDLIVGPGNSYVTAAKRAVYGRCGIDGLAGPSELVVVASGDADPGLVAADLLAQAEHDTSARVMLLSDDAALIANVEAELRAQLDDVTTAATAQAAFDANGSAVVLTLEQAIEAANRLAPEHLHLQGRAAERLAHLARSYGSLFVGGATSATFGDYGAGPNHVLPTGGTARFTSGLSVLTFLNVRTFAVAGNHVDRTLIEQSAMLAEGEGLDGHRRSVLRRAMPAGPAAGEGVA